MDGQRESPHSLLLKDQNKNVTGKNFFYFYLILKMKLLFLEFRERAILTDLNVAAFMISLKIDLSEKCLTLFFVNEMCPACGLV